MHGLASSEWTDLLLSVNTRKAKRRLSPRIAAEYIDRALTNLSAEELAEELGFSDSSTLRKIHRLARLPVELAELVDWGVRKGSVSMSAASELMRLDSDEEVVEAIQSAIEFAMTRDEARQVVQIRTRADVPVRECVERALHTRPKVERTELILGSFTTPKSAALAKELGDGASEKRLKRVLARNFPEVICKSVRVNGTRFALMFEEAQAKKLRASIGVSSLEGVISDRFA